MENPFEIIITKLNHLEKILNEILIEKNQHKATEDKYSDLLTVSQTAEYLSLSKATIYKFTADRIIPHFKRGKRVYFKRSDLENWVTAHRVSSNEEIAQDASNYLMRRKKYRYS